MYTSNYKIHKLMTWIPRKGSNALYHFIICLRHSADGTGHQELADKLEKEARKGRQYTTKNGTLSDTKLTDEMGANLAPNLLAFMYIVVT